MKSAFQPNDLVHVHEIFDGGCDFFTAHLRVSVLVQQAFLGREQRPLAIRMDRAAFQH
ncbi:hypothetical protein D3C76_1811400 [compost metagenome]